MVVFINGSINSGKTTVGKLLAERLGFEFLDFDTISGSIDNFNLQKDIPKVFEIGIKTINELIAGGKGVVATFVIRYKDYEQIQKKVKDEPVFITLAPKLRVALTNRGTRELTQWQKDRVKYHYKTGVPNPSFGKIIDNSTITPEETVDKICEQLKH